MKDSARRFLFVTTTLSIGGAERVVSLLASSLAELGHEACILKYYEVDNEYPVSDKVTVVNMSGGGSAEYRKISYLEKVRRIRRILRQQRPDFVIPFLFQVALCTEIAAFGVKTCVLQSIRNNPTASPAKKTSRILRDLLVYNSKCTLVQNQVQKDYFPKKYHSKIHVLFNPIAENLLAAQWNPPKEQFVVCGIGRLERQKNFTLLMDAFRRAFADIPEAVLQIYGQGSLMEELKAYAEKTGLGDRIQMMGRSNDIQSVYERTSLFVLSSDFEGMPNALMEAMAVGVPCISTNCPTGPSDLVDHGENGLLVPVGDLDAMAETMREIYDQKYDLKRMTAEARKTIRRLCSADQIAQQMIEICENIA